MGAPSSQFIAIVDITAIMLISLKARRGLYLSPTFNELEQPKR